MNEIIMAIILWLAYVAVWSIASFLIVKQALIIQELIERRGTKPDLAAKIRQDEDKGLLLFFVSALFVLLFLLTIYTIWAVVKAIQYIF